jgi:hypothetical protein
MQKRSFRSGNTFSYYQVIACFVSPGSFPMGEFSQKKRIKSVAGFYCHGKKRVLPQKRAQTFFPYQAITTIIIRRASHLYV